MASGASASTGEAMDIPSTSQPHELFLGEEEVFDSSLSTFYTFDKENAGQTSLAQQVKLARGGGCGGCGCGHGGLEAAVDMAATAAAALHMAAAVAARVPVSAALVPVSAALVPVLSVALADAHFMYTADAPFLDAASAAVAVAAEAAAVGAHCQSSST